MTTAFAFAGLNPLLSHLMEATANDVENEPGLDCHACSRPAKCCDFQPFVANFLLGAALSDPSASGALTALLGGLDIVAASSSSPRPAPDWHLLPIGLVASAEFRARHARWAGEPEARGNQLACVFFDRRGGRRCRIWRWRPGECSTYLCSPMNGRREALSRRVFDVEVAVAQMALAYQGFSAAQVNEQVEAINQPPSQSPPAARAPFSAASESPWAIYRRAYDWARELEAAEVKGWLAAGPAPGDEGESSFAP